MLDVHAEDMSFSTLWPRPEKGYEAYFASMDQYRTLFTVLSRPGCLELLEYLNSQTSRLYVPEALATALRMPRQEPAIMFFSAVQFKRQSWSNRSFMGIPASHRATAS